MNRDLERSYAHCREVVRRASSNLAWCFWLLPADQRRGMDALYALARLADDIVDAESPAEQRRQQLAELRRELAGALEPLPPAAATAVAIIPAVADAACRFSIPHQHLFDLLDGVAMDLAPQTPATFEELRRYCYRVASAVGLACLPIWGTSDERAIPPAIDCGIAFQLTNILRDLKEDAERGRCYLPADEMERFGICSRHTPCAVGAGDGTRSVPAADWLELIDFQIARAKTFYASAAETARYLPRPGRRVFALMLARYRAILAAIERDPARILRERVTLSWPRKVVVAARAILASPKSQVQSPKSRSRRLETRNLKLESPRLTLDFGLGTLDSRSVAILGGGLAGLAAAAALCQRGFRVELFEARQRLGGRAGSYVDKTSGERVDHCQHVAMGCCTSFLDFCRQTGTLDLFTRHHTLHFFGPDGKRCDFSATSFLPAPLHLAGGLERLTYLSRGERWAIARAMLRLARMPAADDPAAPTIGQWLSEQKQSPAAIERFWQVVLVSALGESLDRASLAAARKVFVDGFMASRAAYEVFTPNVPLGEIYDVRVADWLRKRGVKIHLGCPVERVQGSGFRGQESKVQGPKSKVEEEESEVGGRSPARGSAMCVTTKNGVEHEYDFVIAAMPWRRLPEVLAPELAAALPEVMAAARRIESSPITGIHLWFDRPITELPHAVIVGRLAQWLFAKQVQGPKSRVQSRPGACDDFGLNYYQVVISASRSLAGRERDDVLREVLDDLREVFPDSRDAQLVRWQMVTEQEAVFSVRPGLDALRPAQQTAVPNFLLAGDWTATHWPSTMEGAVRSGFLAAEALLASLGRPQPIVAAELPRGWLARAIAGP